MSSRDLVAIVALMPVLITGTVSLTYLFVRGHDRYPEQLIGFLFTCLLGWTLIAGWNPGRRLAILLNGSAGLMCIVIYDYTFLPIYNVGMIVMGVIYSACAIILLSPHATAHFQQPEPPPEQLPTKVITHIDQLMP